jgi:Subtilase family
MVYIFLLLGLQAINGQNVTVDTVGDLNITIPIRFVITFDISAEFPAVDVIENFIQDVFSNTNDIYEKVLNLPTINAIVLRITIAAAKRLIRLPFVKYVELDYPLSIDTVITEPISFDSEETPYGINLVGAMSVSDSNIGNRKVCIIDSGFDVNHPDLPSLVTGTTMVDEFPWNEDGSGHGTHVAGIIAAIGGNEKGTVGVIRNGQINLHIVRVFSDKEKLFVSDMVGAVQSCADAGSNIISLSVGHQSPTNSERSIYDKVYSDGILIVAAAGNLGSSVFMYPASYDSVLSVASVGETKNSSFFSNFNNQVDISAPGELVFSSYLDGTYALKNGTSQATPHVAGVAALVWSIYPNLTNVEIRNALLSSAEDLGNPGYDIDYGYGLVRADLAVSWIENCGLSMPPNNVSSRPPSASPVSGGTGLPPSTGICQNYPSDWKDPGGDGCDFYDSSLTCNMFGDYFKDKAYGKTAKDVCCKCGGGLLEDEDCMDDDSWTDSFGDGCQWYNTTTKCSAFGNSFENDGKTAHDVCCFCKDVIVTTIQSQSKELAKSTTNSPQPINPVSSKGDITVGKLAMRTSVCCFLLFSFV